MPRIHKTIKEFYKTLEKADRIQEEIAVCTLILIQDPSKTTQDNVGNVLESLEKSLHGCI